jgi:hypothetical protein
MTTLIKLFIIVLRLSTYAEDLERAPTTKRRRTASRRALCVSRKAQSQEIVEHGRMAQGGHRQLVSLLR